MSQNFSIFVSTKKQNTKKSSTPMRKGTNIFSEIGKFFKENDATDAMNAIMDMPKVLNLLEKKLFGDVCKLNCKVT